MKNLSGAPLSTLVCHLPRPGESFLSGEPLAARAGFLFYRKQRGPAAKGRPYKTQTPFSNRVTVRPSRHLPVILLSSAPIMTSSWMEDWFMPRASSSSLERVVPFRVVREYAQPDEAESGKAVG